MGRLIEGVWRDEWYDTKSTGGKFVRKPTSFRDWVTADGESGFKAEPGRYHLYVSRACPWAHRTVILRTLKGLDDVISLSSVSSQMLENGWEFGGDGDADPLYGKDYLHQIYTLARSDYTGRVTVPVLFDRKTERIVSNESSEIIRMLNSAFDAYGNAELDFYPAELRDDIDRVNGLVYETVNNGVYKCGFATTQGAYEEAFDALFATLDELDRMLGRSRYLIGDRMTEADWRLFTTLVRFDAVYHGHFKANLRRISDYSNLGPYLRELYQVPGIRETVDIPYIKRHYYGSHRTVNPTGIVPKGPALDLEAPHDRDRLPAASLPLGA
jgi:putative glutathione S-transferase